MEYVRIGIIGIGNIGSAHASCLYKKQVEGAKLCALCDTSKKRRTALSSLYPDIPIFDSADALLESNTVDAVIISTPHYDHPEIAIKAFKAGLHVLSEKPIGVYGKAAKEMVEAAKNSKKIFAVMFNQRTNKLFKEAKKLIFEGRLGELKRSVWIVTNWYRKQCYYDSGNWRATWSGEGGGVLMNQAPHNLDLWQWICGMPKEINAVCDVAKYHDIEVEDDATIFARYENGATGVFITSTGEYPGTNRLEISGTKGKIVIERGELEFYELPIDESEYRQYPDSEKVKPVITKISDEPYSGHLEIIKNFTRAILYGDDLVAKGEEGLAELSICNAAYLSAWTGRTISLPLDDGEYLAELNKKRFLSQSKETTTDSKTTESKYSERWSTNW